MDSEKTCAVQPLNFSSIRLVRVLNNDDRTKSAAVLVKIDAPRYASTAASPATTAERAEGREDCDLVDAIILAEKTAFSMVQTDSFFAGLVSQPNVPDENCYEHIESNDIYHRYLMKGLGDSVKLIFICPATEAHVRKYTRQERRFVCETPQMYTQLVKPYYESSGAARIKWIDNIIAGKSEVEKCLYASASESDGFFLLPDSKWDGKSMEGLYYLAICARRDIRTIRDLTSEHLPLLCNIRDRSKELIPAKYPGLIRPDQLRLFIHYVPTYFHFHVHVCHVLLDSMAGCAVGQAHLLDDIIDNLENISPDYYQKRTLHYSIGIDHALYSKVAPEHAE